MGLPEPNFAAVERAIRDLLIAIGENPDRDGLKKTPYRIAKMYNDVSAEHSCMTLRGVKSPGAITTTISHRGCFSNDREMREHFVELASS